jgi:ABC-type multidrug transport system fused ATPase/permease subunit
VVDKKKNTEEVRRRRRPVSQGRVLRRTIHHLGPFLLPRWPMLFVALFALVMHSAFEVLKPWPIALLFDFVLIDDPLHFPAWLVPPQVNQLLVMLVTACVMIVGLAVLSSMAAYFREYLLRRLGEEVAFDIRVGLFRHIQSLSLNFHDSTRVGDLIERVTGDVGAVRKMATESILQFATCAAILVSFVAIMLWVNWTLALIAVGTVPLLIPIVIYFRWRIERASTDRKKQDVEISSLAQETVTSIRLVKTFGREGYQQKKFGRESSLSVRAGLDEARYEAGYIRTVDIVMAIGTAALVFLGVHEIWSGDLKPGQLLAFVAYQRGLYAPLRDMAKETARIAKGKVALRRVLEIMDLEPEVEDAPDAVPAPPLRGEVEFRNVSFAYVSGRPVLHEVNFRIAPGQVVALVGPSGAGKTSIANLIPRLYDPTVGHVLIDGLDLRGLKLQSLRDQMSTVLQESVLLQTSILENVLYGRPDATEEEVQRALAEAGVDQFAERLPERYLTVVGPRGATLSGGERQRVAIARAMVRNTPILLLDEPTTGLDIENERLVMQALERLMQGRTTFLISHRLNLIERADLILVVDRGRIVESGSHRELLAVGGVYSRLYNLGTLRGGVLNDNPLEQPVLEAT